MRQKSAALSRIKAKVCGHENWDDARFDEWLFKKNRSLDGERPMKWINDGRHEELERWVDSLVPDMPY